MGDPAADLHHAPAATDIEVLAGQASQPQRSVPIHLENVIEGAGPFSIAGISKAGLSVDACTVDKGVYRAAFQNACKEPVGSSFQGKIFKNLAAAFFAKFFNRAGEGITV
jgi:hypothetical protein